MMKAGLTRYLHWVYEIGCCFECGSGVRKHDYRNPVLDFLTAYGGYIPFVGRLRGTRGMGWMENAVIMISVILPKRAQFRDQKVSQVIGYKEASARP